MQPIVLFRPALLVLTLTVAGCSLAPNYQRPEAPVAASWTPTVEATGSFAADVLDWKTFIIDPQLHRVVDAALSNNRSLRQALLDIEAARAQYRVQRADRLPSINANATGSRQRLPADLSSSGRSDVSSSYQVGPGLTEYEVDLFGRVRNLSESALETYLATEEATRATQVSLIAEVIEAYLTRDGAQRRLALVEQTLKTREDSLELISRRRQAGTATALDYQEALGLAEQAKAERESTLRLLQQTDNALVLLVGTPDANSLLPAAPRDSLLVLQDIAPGTPSTLIERRPDILASEHRLKARNADIGAARAAFFPRLSLTGSVGSSSTELSGLFDGGSRAWSFAPSLSLPIFAGGRNRANLDLAEVRKDAAVAAYEGTIQVAFREVADALTATDTLRREEAARRALADSSVAAMTLAKARYDGGVDDYLRYLDAQRSTFGNQVTLIQISTERQIALVDLFKSLGGGWEESPAGVQP
ncbi:MAG: outer membrane protein multidrug efflux system [Pseudomonadota bacterium]|jgi:multidrug efflux system outer membrane protein|uniref:Efflux transporter outer membrane subunit n=1 Tax=Pseudomonas psychrophila TaxID=122355 RepID=A0A8I1FVQ6_9PSED|nr:MULTISPECIES: efflux transporter outer membrane subunit [Pseudomonas]MBP9805385.1 efflux transporter outer membrane subunit [Accumulibacter sp.]MDQ1302194.1 outer membrane protein multidrug efflux system [Pseudomonadota bacterium]CAD24340.1 OprJ protein [uncultured bacterium]HRL52954.1 efflux transporter outer membrane subunit [Acidovorax temperans]MBJ2259939.1 efflux transporter outer membrane subunit [Pseudomonas psychrophila]